MIIYSLFEPKSYQEAPKELKEKNCNGCGPKSMLIDVVPDTAWGLDISEACNIHDWMYAEGQTIEHKEEADRTFLNNMLRLIHNAGGWGILKLLRRRRALTYYQAVKYFGGPAFWSGKSGGPQRNIVPPDFKSSQEVK